MRRLVMLTAALLAAASIPAAAQPADVPALIKMIETQPADMDKSAWKEKRRESARKLVASKDKRAIPELIKLVETETFDIIGEIAIDGLGNFGDQSAVPALQKAANDSARDKSTRELARKALAKLGADAKVTMTPQGGGTTGGGTTGGGTTGGGTTGGGTTGGGTTGGGTTGGGTTGGGTTGGGTTGGGTAGGGTTGGGATGGGATGGGAEGGGTGLEGTGLTGGEPAGGSTLLGGGKTTETVPAGPSLADDTIGAYDRLTFAIGAASLSYDTVRKRPAFDADVAARWQKRIERPQLAWGYDVGAHFVGGLVNPEGRAATRGAQLSVDGAAEARFYAGKVYGIGKAAVGFQLDYVSYVDMNAGNDFKDTRSTADLQAAIGGGYGRILDVGAAIRVRRLARTLDAARALGKQIDAATSRKLQLAWWGLRGERSSYRALVVTVAILREAGILLGEPDAGLSYELLTVLRDTQLFLRPDGLDVQLVVAEGYLVRPTGMMDPTPAEEGRIEQVALSAGYGKQLADDKAEVSGTAFARARLLAPDTQPSPWALGATGRLRRFAYGDHGDPVGALDVAATVALSKDGAPMGGMSNPVALRIQGEAGFTWWMNQASGLRVAATLAEDAGELFFGASLQATYGLLDGTFAQ